MQNQDKIIRKVLRITGIISITFIVVNCHNLNKQELMSEKYNILFLHHSTGNVIWKGGVSKLKYKIGKTGNVQKWFSNYNHLNNTNYAISDRFFPARDPYGWNNYPFDYYTIWVKNSGDQPYKQEPTLEMLTKDYDMIIWKHCFPVGRLEKSPDSPDINSPVKTIENYTLQYNALKKKMHEFPETKFIVWTGAALVEKATTEEQARGMKEFVTWVKEEWDDPEDNIFIWDLYQLQTEGEIYFKNEYAESEVNPHPSDDFARRIHPYFCQRIIDVIEGRGDTGNITGELK